MLHRWVYDLRWTECLSMMYLRKVHHLREGSLLLLSTSINLGKQPIGNAWGVVVDVVSVLGIFDFDPNLAVICPWSHGPPVDEVFLIPKTGF